MEATNHVEKPSQHTIPEGWREFFLGELGEVKMCKRVMKHQTLASGEIPFYKIGTFGGTPDAYISRDLFTDFRSRFSYPKKGDILLSAAGTIGRTVVFDGEDSYFQDSNIVWIDNKEDKVLNSLLYYCYKVMKFHTENGGIVVRLYNENLRNTHFCAPESLEEQERIAKALTAVDNMIGALDEAIAKKRQIKEGLMQQLLTGKNGEWVERLGRELFSIGNGRDYKCLKPGRIPVYGTGGLLAFVDEYLHDGPTVCIGRKGTIDKPQYHEGKIWTVDTLFYTYDFRGVNPKFLYYLFCRVKWHSLNEATGVPSLTSNNIMNVSFLLPLDKKEQDRIVYILDAAESEIRVLENKRDKYAVIKQGMMQELLTGKTRL